MCELWDQVNNMFEQSVNDIRVDKISEYDIKKQNLQGINENSVLGQVITNTAGIVVNNYIRIFGSGDNENSHNISEYNLQLKEHFGEGKLFVADDIFGGLFAINNGGFSREHGLIWYFAPDLLSWDNLEITYPEFIAFVSSENINEFYENYIWDGFEEQIKEIRFDEGILIYPFLWSKECNINKADKKIISFKELILLNLEYMKKFNL